MDLLVVDYCYNSPVYIMDYFHYLSSGSSHLIGGELVGCLSSFTVEFRRSCFVCFDYFRRKESVMIVDYYKLG